MVRLPLVLPDDNGKWDCVCLDVGTREEFQVHLIVGRESMDLLSPHIYVQALQGRLWGGYPLPTLAGTTVDADLCDVGDEMIECPPLAKREYVSVMINNEACVVATGDLVDIVDVDEEVPVARETDSTGTRCAIPELKEIGTAGAQAITHAMDGTCWR
jgi:hypothetical protein